MSFLQEMPRMDEPTDTTAQTLFQQRLAFFKTHGKHKTQYDGFCHHADQAPGHSDSLTPTALAQLCDSVPPPEPDSLQPSSPAVVCTPCSQGKQAAATHSPTAPIITPQPVQSDLSTHLGPGVHDSAQDDHAETAWPSQHGLAGQLPQVPPPGSQTHQQQQLEEGGVQPAGSSHPKQLMLQSPPEGLPIVLAHPPAASLKPAKRKLQINLTHSSIRPRKSHRTSTLLAGIKQAFAHRLWQTLGDFLQEVDINRFTFSGKPLTRGQSLSRVTGPSTPAFLPEEYVDTRPLAYPHLLQQENHQPLAPPQPTQTPDPVLNHWPPVHTQLQQQHHTSHESAEHQIARQAADRTPPLQTPDLVSNCHHATHMAFPTQPASVATPAVSSAQAASPSLPNSQAISGQHPLPMGQLCQSGGSPSCVHNPANQSPIQTVVRVLDRLFSGSKAQQAATPQSSSRHTHVQPPPPAPHPAPQGDDKLPAYTVTPHPTSNSRSDGIQQCQWPTASGLYAAPQPTLWFSPDTPAGAETSVQTVLPLPQQQTASPQRQPPQAFLQQEPHQPVGLPNHHGQVPVSHHAHACAHLQALQHRLPCCPAMQVTEQQGGLHSASSLATPLQEGLNSSLGAVDTDSRQHELATTARDAAWAAPDRASEKPYQSVCKPSPSTSARAQTDSDSPGLTADLLLRSPERTLAPSSARLSSPLVLWNSLSSSGASSCSHEPQQFKLKLSASNAMPLQQQNIPQQQHRQQQQQQWQLDQPHTAMQHRPPWLAASGTVRTASAIHSPLASFNKRGCLASSRPAQVGVSSGAPQKQLAGQHASGDKLNALEQIVIGAKRMLRSLDLAVGAPHPPACIPDRVMPCSD